MQLGDLAATPAQEEGGVVRLVGHGAADEGVQAVDAMDEAVAHQKIQGAVDGRRSDAVALGAEGGQNVVGADRPMADPDDFEDAAADGGQAGMGIGADALGAGQGIRDAVTVVVADGGLGHGRTKLRRNGRPRVSPCRTWR